MRRIEKILALVMVIVLFAGQLAYAREGRLVRINSDLGKKIKNFFVKSVYQDRIYGFAYKKVVLPVGRYAKEHSAGLRLVNAGANQGKPWLSGLFRKPQRFSSGSSRIAALNKPSFLRRLMGVFGFAVVRRPPAYK